MRRAKRGEGGQLARQATWVGTLEHIPLHRAAGWACSVHMPRSGPDLSVGSCTKLAGMDSDPVHDGAAYVTAVSVPGLVRAVRRRADMSQRELAKQAQVSRSTVARVESGQLTPSVDLLLRLLDIGRLSLVAIDENGNVVQPMRVWDDVRDGAERRFPAHLDLVLQPRPGEWWGDVYGLARPPETFHRNRRYRDAQRRRSRWEVRVKQFRYDPPPPAFRVEDGRPPG